MKQLAETILKRLIDNPDYLVVEETQGNNSIKLKVSAHPSDVGKIIGKKGQNATAVRTILKAVAVKEQQKSLSLDID